MKLPTTMALAIGLHTTGALGKLYSEVNENIDMRPLEGVKVAGGIGFLLADRIAAYKWEETWSIIFLIIAMVYLIDWLSGLIRQRLIGKTEQAR